MECKQVQRFKKKHLNLLQQQQEDNEDPYAEKKRIRKPIFQTLDIVVDDFPYEFLEKQEKIQSQKNHKLQEEGEIKILNKLENHINLMKNEDKFAKVRKKNNINKVLTPTRDRFQHINQSFKNEMAKMECAFPEIFHTKEDEDSEDENEEGSLNTVSKNSKTFYEDNVNSNTNAGGGSQAQTLNSHFGSRKNKTFTRNVNKKLNKNSIKYLKGQQTKGSEYQPSYLANRYQMNSQLNDQKTRLEVLDRILLRNFFYDDQKEREEKTLLNLKKQDESFDIIKYKNLKKEVYSHINTLPYKHTRLQQIENGTVRNDYYTHGQQLNRAQLMLINKTRRFRSLNMTKKFMDEDLLTQKQKNIEKLQYLIHFESDSRNNDKDYNEKEQLILRRCFHCSSNKDDPHMSIRFQYVKKEKFVQLINLLFDNQEQLIKGLEADKIYDKITKNSENNLMNFYDFTEGLRKVAQLYYQIVDKKQNQVKQYHEILTSLVKEKIMSKSDLFMSKNELNLNKFEQLAEIRDFLGTFNNTLKQIYFRFAQMRSVKLVDIEFFFMGFSDIFEIIWKLGFFPTKVTKLEIKQFYYYTQSKHQGLDYKDFIKFMHLLGMYIVEKGNQLKKEKKPNKPTLDSIDYSNIQQKSSPILVEIQSILDKLEDSDQGSDYHDEEGNIIEEKRQKNLLRKQAAKQHREQLKYFIIQIKTFYIDPDYMDFLNINQKITKLERQNDITFNKID